MIDPHLSHFRNTTKSVSLQKTNISSWFVGSFVRSFIFFSRIVVFRSCSMWWIMLQQMRYFIIAIVIFRHFHCVASCRMLHFDIYTIFVFAFAPFSVAFLQLNKRGFGVCFSLGKFKTKKCFCRSNLRYLWWRHCPHKTYQRGKPKMPLNLCVIKFQQFYDKACQWGRHFHRKFWNEFRSVNYFAHKRFIVGELLPPLPPPPPPFLLQLHLQCRRRDVIKMREHSQIDSSWHLHFSGVEMQIKFPTEIKEIVSIAKVGFPLHIVLMIATAAALLVAVVRYIAVVGSLNIFLHFYCFAFFSIASYLFHVLKAQLFQAMRSLIFLLLNFISRNFKTTSRGGRIFLVSSTQFQQWLSEQIHSFLLYFTSRFSVTCLVNNGKHTLLEKPKYKIDFIKPNRANPFNATTSADSYLRIDFSRENCQELFVVVRRMLKLAHAQIDVYNQMNLLIPNEIEKKKILRGSLYI